MMITRRLFTFAAGAAAMISGSLAASAGEETPFTRQAFEAAQDQAEVRRFKATVQSTLITFKGKQEIARSVGDTNPDSITDLLRLAL